MERIVIIDHETHVLYVEDVSEEALAKYNGEEEAYIRDKRRQWDYDEAPEKKHLEIVSDSDKLIHWGIERLFEVAETVIEQIEKKILS